MLQSFLRHGFSGLLPLQAKAWIPISAQNDLIIHGSPGSGKTFAYLLPLLHNLSYIPSSSLLKQSGITVGEPKILVIVPTHELANQVVRDINIFHSALRNFPILLATTSVDRSLNIQSLREGASSVIVGTPGRLHWLHSAGHLRLGGLEAVVLDEADILLGSEKVVGLFSGGHVPPSAQRVLASATIDDWLKDLIDSTIMRGEEHRHDPISSSPVRRVQLPAVAAASSSTGWTAGEHVLSKSIAFSFAKISSNISTRDRQLRHILDSVLNPSSSSSVSVKCVVFCASKADVALLDESSAFVGNGYPVVALHGDQSVDERGRSLARFTALNRGVLLTTDLASRGLNLDRVRVVLHLGLPRTAADFIHRVGRIRNAESLAHCQSICLLRAQDLSHWTPLKRDLPELSFTLFPLPNVTALRVQFLEKFARSVTDDTPTSDLWESAGDKEKLLAGILLLVDSRRVLVEGARSLLSGMSGFVPLLLLDPFLKRFSTKEKVDVFVRQCLLGTTEEHVEEKKKKISIGRIALSEHGFLVDVPRWAVHRILTSRALKRSRLRAILVTGRLPPLVENESAFLLRRAMQDRKRVYKSSSTHTP